MGRSDRQQLSPQQSSRQLLPVRVRSVQRDRQTPVRADVDRVLDHTDLAAADRQELLLKAWTQPPDQARAAGEDDVVADLLLILGLYPGEQVEHGLDQRRQDA